MGAFNLEVDSAYGWVLLDVIVSVFVLTWKGIMVGVARKRYGVEYPTMYAVPGVTRKADENEPLLGQEGNGPLVSAADCHAFNCYQRAHQNTLENYPFILAFLLLGGLLYPVTTAIAGALWIVGRVVYALGYMTGDPKKRLYAGILYAPGLLVLLGVNIAVCCAFLKQWMNEPSAAKA